MHLFAIHDAPPNALLDQVLTVSGILISAAFIMIGRWVLHVRKVVESLDRSVNNRPQGEPTIYELVREAVSGISELKTDFAQHLKDDEFNFADLRARLSSMGGPDEEEPATPSSPHES